jgi:hypothetical protein
VESLRLNFHYSRQGVNRIINRENVLNMRSTPDRRSSKPSPIFICGPARSGTTLLVRLLDSHPELAVLPEETYLYQDLLLRRRLSWLVVHLSEILDFPQLPAILNRSPFSWFAFSDRERLRSRLQIWLQSFENAEGAATEEVIHRVTSDRISGRQYWQVFLEAYEQLMPGRLQSSRYWLEKTPSNERFTALHEGAFSSACRYIHIIRDPRDVAASWLKRRGESADERARTLVRICYLWSLSVHLAAYGLRAYPGRYHVLRYENLVQKPQEVVQELCRFLEIEFRESMLTPTKLGKPVPPNSSYAETEAKAAVISSQIGRFADVLTDDELRFVEGVLCRQMTACGYVPEAARETVANRPRLPQGAQRAWQSRTQLARIWKFQQKFVNRSLLFA